MENQSFTPDQFAWNTYIQTIGLMHFSSDQHVISFPYTCKHIHCMHHLITLWILTQYCKSNLHEIRSVLNRLIDSLAAETLSLSFSLLVSDLSFVFSRLFNHSFSNFSHYSVSPRFIFSFFLSGPVVSHSPFNHRHPPLVCVMRCIQLEQ